MKTKAIKQRIAVTLKINSLYKIFERNFITEINVQEISI